MSKVEQADGRKESGLKLRGILDILEDFDDARDNRSDVSDKIEEKTDKKDKKDKKVKKAYKPRKIKSEDEIRQRNLDYELIKTNILKEAKKVDSRKKRVQKKIMNDIVSKETYAIRRTKKSYMIEDDNSVKIYKMKMICNAKDLSDVVNLAVEYYYEYLVNLDDDDIKRGKVQK